MDWSLVLYVGMLVGGIVLLVVLVRQQGFQPEDQPDQLGVRYKTEKKARKTPSSKPPKDRFHAIQPQYPSVPVPEGGFEVGLKLYQEYRYHEALPYFLQAVREDKHDKSLHYRIARIYQSIGDPVKAETALKNVLAIDAQDIKALLDLTRLYIKQGKYNLALRSVNQLIEEDPQTDDGLLLKVKILIELEELTEAQEVLKALLEQTPENSDLLMLLAMVYKKAQAWPEAMDLYENLLVRDPTDRKNLKFSIAELYMLQGDYANAIETLTDIVASCSGTIPLGEINTYLAQCYRQEALVCYRAGQVQEAVDAFHRAIGVHPTDAESYRGLAKLYVDEDRIELAIDYYEKALDIGPPNATVYTALAQLYESLDRFDEAISLMKHAEKLTPTAQVYFYLGTLFGMNEDFEGCVTYLNRAVAKDPDMIDGYYNLGVAYEAQKRFKDAQDMYKKVLELDKHHKEAKANYKHLRGQTYTR